MIFLASNLGPTVSETMLTAGPLLVPVIFALLALAAWLAGWLLSTGIRRLVWWRLALGAPLALYLVVVAAAFITNA